MNTVFSTTLNQMLVFFLIMVTGYILSKKNIVDDNADHSISSILAFAIGPALSFKTFYENFKPEILGEKLPIILYSFAILFALTLLSLFLTRFFTKDDYLKKIVFYSLIMGNYGYIGYPLTEAVFGSEALFDMMLFCIPLGLFVYTIAFPMLNPNLKKFSIKAVINPPFIAMILGMIVGYFNIKMPSFIESAASSLSNCMGAMAMLMTGIVIAKYNFKEIVLNLKFFIASLFRLVIIPAFLIFVLRLLNVPSSVQLASLCSYAIPMGLNTVVFPSAFGGDTKPGASMALISNIMGVITIPIMFAIFA